MDLNYLFQAWFQLEKYVPLQNKKDVLNVNFPETKLENLWRLVWFAKKDDQKKIDQTLQQFSALLTSMDGFVPQTLPQKFALIILYDQIPRNIFRGTPKAYQFDEKAFYLLIQIICEKCSFTQNPQNYIESINLIESQLNLIAYTIPKALPIHLVITLQMCLIHQENLIAQKLAQEINNSLKIIYPNSFLNIQERLRQIQVNHYDRISNFGRIPERNVILKRQSTEKELAFLKSVEVKYSY